MEIAQVQMGEVREGGSLGELVTFSEGATQATDTMPPIQITVMANGKDMEAMDEVVEEAMLAEGKAMGRVMVVVEQAEGKVGETVEEEADGECLAVAIAHSFYFRDIFQYMAWLIC